MFPGAKLTASFQAGNLGQNNLLGKSQTGRTYKPVLRRQLPPRIACKADSKK